MAFTEELCRILEVLLACISGRKWRHYARMIALERLLELCLRWRDEAITQEALLEAAISEMRSLLPGCSIYFGLLQPRGNAIKYAAASDGSVVVGKRLRRGRGLSFRCVDDKQVLTVRSARERRRQTARLLRPKINAGWPWLAVPLRHGARDGVVRGVLAIDSFELVPKGGDDEEEPEKGVPEFLERVGEVIGTTIDLKSKHDSLEQLAMLQKSGASQHSKLTPRSVYALGLEGLHKNILFARRVEIWQLRNSAFWRRARQGGQEGDEARRRARRRAAAPRANEHLRPVKLRILAAADDLASPDTFVECSAVCVERYDGAILRRPEPASGRRTRAGRTNTS